jgi:chondroitin AC lyase
MKNTPIKVFLIILLLGAAGIVIYQQKNTTAPAKSTNTEITVTKKNSAPAQESMEKIADNFEDTPQLLPPLEQVWLNYFNQVLFSSNQSTNAENYDALLAKINKYFEADGSPIPTDFASIMYPLLELTIIYQQEGSSHYHNPKCKAEIFRIMDAWVQVKPDLGTNWWSHEIGVPRILSKACILMLKELQAERPDLLLAMSAPIKRAEHRINRHEGTNLGDVCTSSIALAVILQDEERIQHVLQLIGSKLMAPAYGGENGFNIDGSYSFHNSKDGLRQMLDGSYGIEYIKALTGLLEFFRNTKFKIAPEHEQAFVNYVLDGYQWKIFEGQADPHCSGRSMYKMGINKVPDDVFLRLAECVNYRRHEIRQFAERIKQGNSDTNSLTGNKMFPMTDFMVNRGVDYYTSVRMSSTRTLGSEGASQWASGDGANLMMHSGREYDHIFSSWDLNRVPGTTAEYFSPEESQIPADVTKELEQQISKIHGDVYARIDLVSAAWQKYVKPEGRRSGAYPTAGGVSDGEFGCCGFEFARGNAYAKKAWFFFNNQFMALGTDIQNQGQTRPIYTAVEQTNTRGNVILKQGNQVLENTGSFELDARNISWISHNQIGYIFPNTAKLHVQTATQSFPYARVYNGTWLHRSNFSFGNGNAVADVFSIWFDHGSQPHGDTYAYQVLIGATTEEIAQAAANSDLKIIQNTRTAQVVENRREKVIQAICYESGVINGTGWRLNYQIDSPKALLIRVKEQTIMLSAADLQMKSGAVLKGSWSAKNQRPVDFEMTLPVGEKAGFTATLDLF